MKKKNNYKRLLFSLLASTVLLSSCGEESQETEEDIDIDQESTAVDISVLADKFYSTDVTVRVTDDELIISTKDLPDHVSVYYSQNSGMFEDYQTEDFNQNPGQIGEQNITLTVPRYPEKASNHQSPGLGPMGVAINSVVFFNQEAGPGDDIFEEFYTFDQYNGHPAQDQYHYHIEPNWLTELKGSDAFLGLLLDGFPVYGPLENDVEITNDDLDDYHGHFGTTTEFPDGIYHYHITTDYPWINGDGYYGTPGTKTE